MGVVVRRYIDILTIIINFPYSIYIRPSFVDTLFPVNRPHPFKPAAWNVIIDG